MFRELSSKNTWNNWGIETEGEKSTVSVVFPIPTSRGEGGGWLEVSECTVFAGSMFAIWIAASNASSEGLQRIRGLELEAGLFSSWASWSVTYVQAASPGGLRVPKHMIPLKQSFSPNLSSTWTACLLSAFVNTWKSHQTILLAWNGISVSYRRWDSVIASCSELSKLWKLSRAWGCSIASTWNSQFYVVAWRAEASSG